MLHISYMYIFSHRIYTHIYIYIYIEFWRRNPSFCTCPAWSLQRIHLLPSRCGTSRIWGNKKSPYVETCQNWCVALLVLTTSRDFFLALQGFSRSSLTGPVGKLKPVRRKSKRREARLSYLTLSWLNFEQERNWFNMHIYIYSKYMGTYAHILHTYYIYIFYV